jgi:hypothetical protein
MRTDKPLLRAILLRGLLLVCPFWLTAAARGEEHYFMVVFGAQRDAKRPKYSHSFGTFVKTTGDGPSVRDHAAVYHTISWLPATLDIHPLRLRPECGVNLDLHASLRLAGALNEKVARWGPFEIHKTLYDESLRQYARLSSGAVLYNAYDRPFRPDVANNCIHALSDTDLTQPKLHVGATHFGHEASRRITRHFSAFIIDPCTRHEWLSERLGLNAYPIAVRELN